jgi:5-methylcytosine-specific restriction protein A
MPYKPKRPCAFPGCPALTDGYYCGHHKQAAEKLYNKYLRDPDTNKRYGRKWKRIRDRYIAANPLCAECGRDGRLTAAEEVHHVIPLGQGGTHDNDNLMSLCTSCHSRITAKHGNRWGG